RRGRRSRRRRGRRGCSCRCRRCQTVDDGDVVDAPAISGDAGVRAHAEAQLDRLPRHVRSEVGKSADETTGALTPGHSATYRVGEVRADRAIVTVNDETTTHGRSRNIGEGSGVNVGRGDFEDATVEVGRSSPDWFQRIIVAETNPGRR